MKDKDFKVKLAEFMKDILPTVNAQFINMDWLAGEITCFIEKNYGEEKNPEEFFIYNNNIR